jgi:dihydroxy-acid dehydratase
MNSFRSAEWFEGRDELGPQNRAVLRTLGWSREFFAGKPVIGIANSWSQLNNCHLGLRAVGAAVARGVIAAGGIPLEFHTMSLGEELMKPTAMLYRNLMAMELEETLRAHPLDGVVLLGGCDKTTPAQLMAAASANLPAISVCAGPKEAGYWRGEPVGSGTDLWRALDEFRAGTLSQKNGTTFEASYSVSYGTCNTMGSASTMAVLAEALGMMLPGSATIPANSARRLAVAEQSGARAVELVKQQILPAQILTRRAFENALTVYAAIGGSTNAIIHLIALARRLRVPLEMEDFDRISARTPVLLDLKPNGQHLMQTFDNAGGVPALLHPLRSLLNLDCTTVSGEFLGENSSEFTKNETTPNGVVRSLENPLSGAGALAVLRGTLAPSGAILRVSTATPALLQHRGRAVVFDSYQDMLDRIDAPDLDVTPDSVLVLRYVGAVGVPGMPEWGMIPIPKKLLQIGVRDMVRLSEARMSGTSEGTVIVHVAPEAASGGPLALVQNGDEIELDVTARRLDLHVDETELARRRAAWQAPVSEHLRGYPRLYAEHVLGPDEGCDFDFLRPDCDAALRFVPPVVGRS